MAKTVMPDIETHQGSDEPQETNVEASNQPETPGDVDFDENAPELMAQIREGYREYLLGELHPIDEFMSELEAEIENE